MRKLCATPTVNKSAAETLGYSRDELIGMGPWELRPNISEAEYRHKRLEPFLREILIFSSSRPSTVALTAHLFRWTSLCSSYGELDENAVFISVTRTLRERRKMEGMKTGTFLTMSQECAPTGIVLSLCNRSQPARWWATREQKTRPCCP